MLLQHELPASAHVPTRESSLVPVDSRGPTELSTLNRSRLLARGRAEEVPSTR
jgi:hypothetical protein